jgi:hypothetical protein
LRLSGEADGLDLEPLGRAWDLDAKGRLGGAWKVSGPLSEAAFSGFVRGDALSVLSTDIRDLEVDVAGTPKSVSLRKLKAKVNDGAVEGNGSLAADRMRADLDVNGIELRSLLARFGVDGGVGGHLNGVLSLRGTPGSPEASFEATSPLTVKETLVDQLKVTVTSPARDKFRVSASGRVGELELPLTATVERDEAGWKYVAESALLDLDKLVTAKMPSMKGRFAGSVQASLAGRLGGAQDRGKSPLAEALIRVPVLEAAGARIQDISLPVRLEKERAVIRGGKGSVYGGKIDIAADVDIPREEWTASVGVVSLDLGKAAEPFMKENGGLAGGLNVNIEAKGNSGALMTVFAKGDFHSDGGDIHGLDVLKKVVEDGKIPFQEIRGSFFWNGQDLWLNPGTQVTASPRAPLYQYFAVSGPLGVMGKGLGLDCGGRFDVQALDSVLGALKGAFQLMTGTLSGGGGQLARRTVGRLLGFTDRDFQDVSFRLSGSWQELQLLDLKIDKSLETYLPVKDEEEETSRKETGKQFQFNLKIPVGSGGNAREDGDDENPEDQLKKQLLDNLLNQVGL